MKDTLARFTMRIDHDLLKRFRYVASHSGRTANKELEQMIRRHIADFEEKHGEIRIDG